MYTVKEAAELLNINPHTVRYYTNMNLIPNMNRDKNNVRIFTDENINYLKGILYLRNCGMSISSIREYFELSQRGIETLPEQYQLILTQKAKLEEQISKLAESQKYLERKLEMYAKFMKENNISVD